MITQKGITREFNRVYGNLKEVFRRVYDKSYVDYHEMCASWFVNELKTLLEDENLRERLTNDQIGTIVFMGMNLSKTKLLDDEEKRCIRGLIKDLKDMQISMIK